MRSLRLCIPIYVEFKHFYSTRDRDANITANVRKNKAVIQLLTKIRKFENFYILQKKFDLALQFRLSLRNR